MDDMILSEVHLEKNVGHHLDEETICLNELEGKKVYVSRFKIKCPDNMLQEMYQRLGDLHDGQGENPTGVEYDEEGDMLLPRRTCARVQLHENILSIPIYHSMASELDTVGLQVWTGSFLMIDYVLENHSHFCGKKVLELGGGTGLTSFVIGMLTESIVVTDIGGLPLKLCAKNFDVNCGILKEPSTLRIVELDWTKCEKQVQDLELQKPDVILACDVIYDDDLTDAFFTTLLKLLSKSVYQHGDDSPIEVLICTEKRLNFTLADLDVTCKEYEHFRKCLSELEDELSPRLLVEQLDTQNIGWHCDYKRTRHIELWRLFMTWSA